MSFVKTKSSNMSFSEISFVKFKFLDIRSYSYGSSEDVDHIHIVSAFELTDILQEESLLKSYPNACKSILSSISPVVRLLLLLS